MSGSTDALQNTISMAVLDKLEKRFRKLGIPNITLYLVFGQAFVYVMAISGQQHVLSQIMLIPKLVLRGEVWRLFTFVFMPQAQHPIFLFFALYIFYLMGSSLENFWGTFRYNVFLLIGYVATVAVSFLTPYAPASVAFLGGSVFLAFATLNPNFQLRLFFMFPIEIKWLALLTWIGYAFTLITGSWSSRFLILASLCNYFVFFCRRYCPSHSGRTLEDGTTGPGICQTKRSDPPLRDLRRER